MESKFVWQPEYNLGVDIIDKEHQRLFRIINKLFTLQEEERDSQWTCQEGIKYFKDHALKHFADEEEYMRSIGYKGLEQHKRIHNDFRDNTLPVLEQELERSGYTPDAVQHFLGVCAGWLIGHTLTEDLAISGKHRGQWEKLLPGKETDAVKKTIIQLTFDMFRLESQLISEAYSGEKFGKGVYYQLTYQNEQSEQTQEVFMVFEEKLLINTVGKAMGLQTGKLDAMLVHASRYTAQQFVGRLFSQIPSMKSCTLKAEKLLTYEQFQEVFKRETLQASLLFNTGGAGYLAFCIVSPHLLEQGIGGSAEKDVPLDDVKRYLSQRAAQEAMQQSNPKQKILIVDDSPTIRLGMMQLLGTDYEVSEADSGIAAIRAVTLDPPDLVLLDYEMPVCDGRQTLEMLRSEKSFAHIPVIFLTSKRDTETMAKAMALNPAGYLLKNSKSADLKKEIDTFFQKAKQKASQESSPKKKILIVDDSVTLRLGMKKLLDEDYEVSEASSGVAAIRAVTLDRPDLVLLDYEMPGCDGGQTLEMLRSEKAFSDIPVIFLTGREDPETMTKAMALNPAGYLLKNSKSIDLKREIDLFFQKAAQKSKPKRKILIVDDSVTIRLSMKKLLSADYEVSEAESGVDAIRAITLARPDLVLLDYEMPGCDGGQTLEMLRSEKAFSDIPVIFLTARRDTQTMIKVMPLKPAGYLLKNAKPAELKREIDAFFEKNS